MDKISIALSALAVSSGAAHSPVQLQKLLFLIDRNIPQRIGGPVFNFEPYDYGPFDKTVYSTMDALISNGLAEAIEQGSRWKKYRLTDAGQKKGLEILQTVDNQTREYLTRVSNFVRSLPFEQLVSSIYKAYPDMRVNSIFRNVEAG